MVKLKAFSRLKNIFSRLNPIPSFKWDESDEGIVIPPSSNELLKMSVKKYPEFKIVILIAIYHLINTRNKSNEFLSVLTKDFRLVADLFEGNNLRVGFPLQVEIEGKNNNILIACHNHFFGAVIPSLGDICNALKHNCNLIAIVSENHIGIVIIEYDLGCDKKLIDEFIDFHGYIDICFSFEMDDELFHLKSLHMTEYEKEKFKLEIYDKFISENIEKFIIEFNVRFNKFNIYEIYIKV